MEPKPTCCFCRKPMSEGLSFESVHMRCWKKQVKNLGSMDYENACQRMDQLMSLAKAKLVI